MSNWNLACLGAGPLNMVHGEPQRGRSVGFPKAGHGRKQDAGLDGPLILSRRTLLMSLVLLAVKQKVSAMLPESG